MSARNYVNLVKAAAYGRAPEAGALPGDPVTHEPTVPSPEWSRSSAVPHQVSRLNAPDATRLQSDSDATQHPVPQTARLSHPGGML
jgi:hypothetical protein